MNRCIDSKSVWFVLIHVVFLLPAVADSACSYTASPGKEGSQSDYQGVKAGITSPEMCWQFCDTTLGYDSKECVAVDLKAGVCFMFTGETTIVDNVDSTHYVKTCTPDPCTMSTRISNTVATSSSMVDVPMTSLADCSAVCKHLGDCEAVTYINGACNIFSAVTSTSQSDSVDYIKTTCTNGNRCCMASTTDKKAAADAVVSLKQTVDSCETACLNYDNCQAVHFLNNICFFHLATPTTSAGSGSTYSSKSCPAGAVDGTATIFTSCPASSGSYNCKRTGQGCLNNGVCQDDGTCECGSSFIGPDCSVDAAVIVNANPPCTNADICGPPDNGVCGHSNSDLLCVCNTGWDAQSQTDPRCMSGRYKVVCLPDRMIININPYGTFGGRIYIWGKPDCAITDSYDTLVPARPEFLGGKVREILHNDNGCGTITPVSENGVTWYRRDVLVRYNENYVSSLDEIVTVGCSIDEKNNTFSYSIDTNTVDKLNLKGTNTGAKLQPVTIEVFVDNNPLPAGSSVSVGQTLTFIISTGSGLNSLLLYGVRIDNGLDNDLQYLDLVVDGCKNVKKGSDIWVSLPHDVDMPSKVRFEVIVFVFTKSSTLRVAFTTRVCVSNTDTICSRIECSGVPSSGRKRRLAADVSNQTIILEKTFHVAYPSTSDMNTLKSSGSETCKTSDAMTGTVSLLAGLVVLLLALLAAIVVKRAFSRSSKKTQTYQRP